MEDSKCSAVYKSVYMKDYEARYPIRPSYLGQVPLRRLGQVILDLIAELKNELDPSFNRGRYPCTCESAVISALLSLTFQSTAGMSGGIVQSAFPEC
ncbi:UNVERIFIED_CONTAM: hypothetical protein FKN15_038900 [Acipenser sinensis]